MYLFIFKLIPLKINPYIDIILFVICLCNLLLIVILKNVLLYLLYYTFKVIFSGFL